MVKPTESRSEKNLRSAANRAQRGKPCTFTPQMWQVRGVQQSLKQQRLAAAVRRSLEDTKWSQLAETMVAQAEATRAAETAATNHHQELRMLVDTAVRQSTAAAQAAASATAMETVTARAQPLPAASAGVKNSSETAVEAFVAARQEDPARVVPSVLSGQ